jgi:hypothetical protein
MGLRLVEKENVSTLATGFLPDVKKAVMAFLDCIEDGSLAPEKAILITLNEDGRIDLTALGRPVGNIEALGMLDLAKAAIVSGAMK